MPKDAIGRIPFKITVNLDGSPTETTGKSLSELAIEQNPDVPEEEIKAAATATTLRVYKILFREQYERLKDLTIDQMSDEEKEKWSFIRLLFSHEIHAEIRADLSKLEAEIEARNQKQQIAKKIVTKAITHAEALAEPIFMLKLPDDYLVKLAQAGFTSVGQIVFSIKVNHETMLDAYVSEEDETKSKKLIEYMKVTKHSLSEILGETGYSLIGSRLLEYNYVTRNEFLDLFRGSN
jgi:hypothetical protein